MEVEQEEHMEQDAGTQSASAMRRRRLAGALVQVLAVVFILAVPPFLVTSNLRAGFNGSWLYSYGFERYEISRATGIPEEELRRVAGEIIEYWSSDAEFLDITVFGRPLYNEREVIHMRDVKGLVQGVFLTQQIAGGFLLVCVLAVLAARRHELAGRLAKSALWGGALTVGLVVVSGLALAVAFPWIFYLFHVISFSNDFWQLDPQRDFLVRMFPEGFWFIATMLVVALTVVEASVLAVGGWLGLRWVRGRSH